MFNRDLTAVDLHKVQKTLAEVTSRALLNEKFRLELVRNPVSVLEANGIYFSEGRRVEVLQSTDDVYYFVLPNQPTDSSGSEVESYASMAGEGGNSSLDTGGPRCTRP